MLRQMLLCSLLLIPMSALNSVAHAEESSEFSDLFGSQLERVKNTPDKDDDLKLASEFLKYLDFDGVDLEMKLRLVDHAFELSAANPEGHTVAEKALRSKLDLAPDQSIDIRTKLYALISSKLRSHPKERKEIYPLLLEEGLALAKAYENNAQADKAADQYRLLVSIARHVSPEAHQQVLQQRKRLVSKISAQKELQSIKEKFLSEPTEALALRAAEILLIVFDQPKEAEAYAMASGNKDWQKQVPLANTEDFSKVNNADLLGLGVWYKKLADDAEEANQAALYARAVTYLELVMNREDLAGLMKVTAQVNHKDASEQLGKLGGTPNLIASSSASSSGARLRKSTDMMPVIRKMIQQRKRHYKTWQVRGESLIREPGNHLGQIGFGNAKVDTEFAVSFELQMQSKEGGFHVRLPVHENHDVDIILQVNAKSQELTKSDVMLRDIIGIGKPGAALQVTVRCKVLKDSAAYVVFINGKKAKENEVKFNQLSKEKNPPAFSLAPMNNPSQFILSNVRTSGINLP